MKSFDIDATLTDRELLAALISHQQYRDDYEGQPASEQTDQSVHGPYQVASITNLSFVDVEPHEAENVIRSWLDGSLGWDGEPIVSTPEAHAKLGLRVVRRLQVDPLYQLPTLDEQARRQFSAVGSTGFLEFVAIDRERNTLALIVASDD